jgi:DNA-binding CsgD family transcriptional regulator
LAARSTETRRQARLAAEKRDTLTLRQSEIVRLCCNGFTNRQIAAHLWLSVTTVRWHWKQINAQLGTHGRVEASGKALALGIVAKTIYDDAVPPPVEDESYVARGVIQWRPRGL